MFLGRPDRIESIGDLFVKRSVLCSSGILDIIQLIVLAWRAQLCDLDMYNSS